MGAHRARANHVDACGLGPFGGFDVEIEHDLHVVADEADRHDDGMLDAIGSLCLERIADVGPEPGLAAIACVVALKHEPPVGEAGGGCRLGAAVFELIDIGRVRCH